MHQQKPTGIEDLIILQATMMKEIRQKQESQARVHFEQGQQIRELAAKMETGPSDYFTIAGFASIRGVRIDVNRAALMEHKAVLLSEEYGYDVGETHDSQFNSYHSDVLAEVFERRMK